MTSRNDLPLTTRGGWADGGYERLPRIDQDGGIKHSVSTVRRLREGIVSKALSLMHNLVPGSL